MIENILNLDNLTKYTDAELENIEKGIAKEKEAAKGGFKVQGKAGETGECSWVHVDPKGRRRPWP